MKQLPNFLIISGNGRNAGKTTFVGKVISSVSKQYPISAIKVSPHFHHVEDSDHILVNHPHYIIRQETERYTGKDSSLMLQSGAKQVFFLEVKDDHLQEAMKSLFDIWHPQGPVICESGGLRSIINPSLFILINRNDRPELKEGFKKLVPLADKIVYFDGEGYDYSPDQIFFDGEKWLFE